MLDRLDQPFRGFGDPCNCVSVFNNTVPSQVYLYQSPVNSKTGLWAATVYANDAWQVNNRLTLNLGLRLDRYQPFLPEQVGPAGQNFAAVDNILVWKNIGPRIGASYDVSGKGKTVVKVNYGRYWLYPAADFANNINPNPATWRQIYTWRDGNGNGRWDSGEQQGSPTSVTGGTAATVYDPGHPEHVLASGDGLRRARGGAEPRRPHRTCVERTASAHEARRTSTGRSAPTPSRSRFVTSAPTAGRARRTMARS